MSSVQAGRRPDRPSRHLPSRLTLERGDSPINDAWLAIRDGGALTVYDVARVTGHPATQIAVSVGCLLVMGAAARVRVDGEDRYVNARYSRWWAAA